MVAQLFEKNRAWSEEKRRLNPHYFENLAAIQKPDYLWIGCSDSRVPANVIAGLEPGEVFVHRNVANLIHPADMNMLSVVEFAVNSLGVRDIIVCGHYGCGGIRAAMDGKTHGLIDHWLQPIRDTAESNFSCLECLTDETSRLNKLCELTIASQVARLARTPIIQSAWKAGQQVSIHGWVYGLNDGLLSDLECTIGPKG